MGWCMGTAVVHFCQNASALLLDSEIHPPNTTANIPKPIQTHAPFFMRLRSDLTLKRVSKRIQNSRVFCLKHMATNSDQESINKEKEEQSNELPPPPPPPPPEKPEPGDCCGSGCVRCVWDVYYEELEAYDMLYKTDSTTNTKSN